MKAPALLPDVCFPASFGKSAVLLPFTFLLLPFHFFPSFVFLPVLTENRGFNFVVLPVWLRSEPALSLSNGAGCASVANKNPCSQRNPRLVPAFLHFHLNITQAGKETACTKGLAGANILVGQERRAASVTLTALQSCDTNCTLCPGFSRCFWASIAASSVCYSTVGGPL